jgi:hypothetical protein
VTYVGSGRRVLVWHHVDLAGEVEVGAPVRLHEEYSVLGGPFGWLNVMERWARPVPVPTVPLVGSGR